MTPLTPVDQWFTASLAVAMVMALWSVRRGAAAFGGFAAILIAGGAAQLALTEPLWFPALRLRPAGARDMAMWAILALEAGVGGAWLLRRGPWWTLRQIGETLGLGRVALALLISAAFSVSVMGYFAPEGGGLRLTAWLAHVVMGGALIAVHGLIVAAMLSVRSPVRGVHALSPVAPAMVAVLASTTLSVFAFENLPHVEDELAYLFQARTFAAGALTAPAPPELVRPALDYYLLDIADGRWFATTAPGWPAVLALGAAVRTPWLINPLLAGISVLLAHAIARRRLGREAADWLAIVMACSPWLLASAATLMTHTLTLVLILAAWLLVMRASDRGRRPAVNLLAAGLALGWVFATRALDGLIVGTLTGAWILFSARGGAAVALVRAGIYSLGCLLTGGLALIYNAAFTGRLTLSPLDRYLARTWGSEGNAYGFGATIGPPGGWGTLDLQAGHTPFEGFVNTLNNIAGLQFEFLGWPIGSLTLVLAFLMWGLRRSAPRDGFALAMIVLIVTVMAAMFFYWFAGSFYIGPRYWFLMAFPLLYLSAAGYQALALQAGGGEETDRRGHAVILVLCVFGLAVFTPWRGVEKYHGYGNYGSSVARAAASGTFGNAVVLVTTRHNIGSALVLNDPFLRRWRPVFLPDTGTWDDAALAEAFPGRKVIRYADPE